MVKVMWSCIMGTASCQPCDLAAEAKSRGASPNFLEHKPLTGVAMLQLNIERNLKEGHLVYCREF